MNSKVPDLERSYQAARAVTRHHAKSFYFSSFTLPALKRRRAYAVYAFCRHLDDVVDEAEAGEVLAAVRSLKEMTARVFARQTTARDQEEHPWLAAFLDTAQECEIPESHFQDLLTGVEMDQGRVRLQTWEELDRYCYHVAGVVGLMMTRVFSLEDRSYEQQALNLGTAMQLTNILRDVAEDLHKDRIYLPRTELEEYGITEEMLRAGEYPARWTEFMRFQVARARDYYQASEPGIRALAADGSQRTVWLMRRIYAEILDEIEKVDYQVLGGRVYVSSARKCIIALQTVLGIY
ncbi:MAG: phytoene/squalene synthase family protein [Blastochloris sp.]|nr:phytoene/squalene synthase family protein [Blastochloris sp.]